MANVNLPISPLLPRIVQTLAEHPVLILQAPPGAGKTTHVPLALLKTDFLAGQKILMLEPRRLATSNAAYFMASQLGEAVGQTVGYRIRYARKVSPQTRLEVVTEGILTRRLQRDPELSGVGLLIFDEFHERHLQSDLALALSRDIQAGLRPELKLLIMSATLDAGPLARQLNAPILTSEGHSYPVTIHHFPQSQKSLVTATVSAIQRALRETTGDLLVFLPGEREIRQCQQELNGHVEPNLLCPLFSNLPFSEQECAIRPATQRKIVLATNIAETSLTIEGVGVVIDSGYSRQPRFDADSGLTQLKLVRISQASATQRTGRAGRLGPGHCYRLWSEGTHAALLPFTPPEVRTVDLAPLVLELLAWGCNDPAELFWLDPPSPSAWQNGLALLEQLGALNDRTQLNTIGRQLASLPTHPRMGRLLVAAQEHACPEVGCDLVALLGESGHSGGRTAERKSDSDILDLLEEFWQCPQARKLTGVARASRYWRRFFNLSERVPSTTSQQLAQLLTAAYPDRIGKRREPGVNRYLLSSGHGARLSDRSALKNPDLLIAVKLHKPSTGETEIVQASSIDEQTLTRLLIAQAWQKSCHWDPAEERIVASERKQFGALVIKERPASIDAELAQRTIFTAIREHGLKLLKPDRKAEELQCRLQFLHCQLDPEQWPDFSEQDLLATLEDWLQPFIGIARNGKELQKINLHKAFLSRLDWSQQRQLEKLAPEKLTVPSGASIRLSYSPDQPPVLAVKLQEMFGQLDTPRVAGGQIAVMIHLLSPAGRPLQITQDLRHFWKHSYPEICKEMKGRYPKHPWPEDPVDALPTAKTKLKLSRQGGI